MATSSYFNNYNSITEQRVVEDLIVESIKIMGFDAYYLPNDNDTARDLLYGEDPVKKFKSAFPVEFYLSNSLEYMGEREFFSKFGLEIKNNVTVIISKRSFAQRVPQNTFTRPREGDLIYVPFLNGTGELYEIKFTNHTKDFFTLGRKIPYFYELELEKFKYSHEIIDTGIEEIDDVATQSSYTIQYTVTTGNGNYTQKEIAFQSNDGTQNNAFATGVVQEWNAVDKKINLSNIYGEFRTNTIIKGASSNAAYFMSTYNPLDDVSPNENFENKYIEDQANNILDFSETNPFGNL
jgi:hypothetical protein